MLRLIPRDARPLDRREAAALHPYQGVTARLLFARGITDAKAADAFLHPSLSQLHDPFLMHGMKEAAAILEAAKAGTEALFRKRNVQLYSIVFYISIFVSFCFTILAETVINILYGESYLPATVPLRVITWYTAFSYLGVARNAWIVAKNRQKYLFGIYAVSALANVVLNCLLIPPLGAAGAAIASLVAQVFTTLVVPFFIKDTRENSMMILDGIMLKGVLWNRDQTLQDQAN